MLSETQIQFLEKGLDFKPIQKNVNKPEKRKDFEHFSRRMLISGISKKRILKIFLMNQSFDLRLFGNFLLVILVWNFFKSTLKRNI